MAVLQTAKLLRIFVQCKMNIKSIGAGYKNEYKRYSFNLKVPVVEKIPWILKAHLDDERWPAIPLQVAV